MSRSYKQAMDNITLSECAKSRILNDLQNYTPKRKINYNLFLRGCACAACLALCVFSVQKLDSAKRFDIQNSMHTVQDSAETKSLKPTLEAQTPISQTQAQSSAPNVHNPINLKPTDTETNSKAEQAVEPASSEDDSVQSAQSEPIISGDVQTASMFSRMEDANETKDQSLAKGKTSPIEGYMLTDTSVIRDIMTEEVYQSGDNTLVFRYAPIDDDLSGDFDDYDMIKTVDNITIKGNDDKFRTAVWHSGGYSYSLVSNLDFAEEEFVKMAKQLQIALQN